MTNLTTTLALKKATDSDNAKTYLETDLGGSLDTVDGLFHPSTGHTHTGAGTNAPRLGQLVASQATGDLFYASGASALARLAAGTSSQALLGGASAPVWGNVTQRQFARGSTTPTSTATSYADTPDPQISLTTTGGDVLVLFVGSIACSTVGALMGLRLALAPLSNDGAITQWAAVANNAEIMVALGYWPAPAAGAYTVKAQWQTNAGTLSANGTQRYLLALEIKA